MDPINHPAAGKRAEGDEMMTDTDKPLLEMFPLPWRVVQPRITQQIKAANDYFVLDGVASYRGPELAHIVRCVNSHDELVAALKQIAWEDAGGHYADIARSTLTRLETS